MSYAIVLKKDHNAVFALCDSKSGAEVYLSQTLPVYCARGYWMDKTLKPSDFEAVPVKKAKK